MPSIEMKNLELTDVNFKGKEGISRLKIVLEGKTSEAARLLAGYTGEPVNITIQPLQEDFGDIPRSEPEEQRPLPGVRMSRIG